MNICKDKLKHWWMQKVSDIDEQPEMPDSKAEETAVEKDLLEQVMALPEKHKEVVWLYYYEGYSTDEIAGILGSPPSTIRNRLRDARSKLKHLLEDSGGDEL